MFHLLFHRLFVFHHSRCDSALSVFASKCQGALCDLGDPGWGDLWFPLWAALLFTLFSTSLLLRPLQHRPLRDLINQLIPYATCFETCGTTWRKPYGVGRKKSIAFHPLTSPFLCFCVFSVLLLIGGHYPLTHKMSSCMSFPLLVAIPLLCVLFGLFWMWLCFFVCLCASFLVWFVFGGIANWTL